MLIKKVCLSNFKNFDNIEVTLGQMNVVVGANAAGKSNFMQSLKFIRDVKNYGIENAISLQGGVEYLRNIKLKERNNIKICIDFSPKGGNIIESLESKSFLGVRTENISYLLELSVKHKNKYEIIKEEIKYNTELQEVPFDTNELKGKKKYIEKSHGKYRFAVTSVKGKLFYDTELHDDQIEVIMNNGKKKIISADKIRPFLIPFEFFKPNYENKKTLIEQFNFLLPRSIDEFKIYDFDLKNSKKPASITSKVQLEENGENLAIVLKNILEDREQKRKFSNLINDILPFVRTVDVEKSQDKSLFFKVKEIYNSGVAIPSSLLSDGTISITSIVTALFFEDNQLAAFEEPEQGIHPALIGKLMRFFYDSSSNKQIIITTHSPEILKHTKLNDLFLVMRDIEGSTSITKPGDQEMVKAFLENELGIDQLFVQNLLDI